MIAQIGIFVFGLTAVFLVNDPRPRVRRFGCVFGLIAQPFWCYETFVHAQWGIFASSIFYGYSWARGFYFAWVKA